MTGPDDHSSTRPISVAELLAKNGTIGAPPVGGRRRRRRGNADAVTVAELTGEIPIIRPDEPEPSPTPVDEAPAAETDSAAAADSETAPSTNGEVDTAEPEVEAVPDAEPQAQVEAEPEVEQELDVEAEPEAESESEVEAEPEPEAVPDSGVEPSTGEGADSDVDLIIMGGREAWKVADQIRARDIPVIINVMDNAPGNFDETGVRLDSAALLSAAGVRFALMTEDLFSDNRTLNQGAGVSVAYGLDWDSAIAAITRVPAEIWGLGDRYGSIETGMEADLVLWDGDPLEVTSAPVMMLIRGEAVDLTNRQLRLRDRYSTLKNATDQPFGYR